MYVLQDFLEKMSELPTEKYSQHTEYWLEFYIHSCYFSLQDDGNVHSPCPQNDLIDEQKFIEENFNDDEFQTTC